jgi:putative cell wall-binding protein
MKIKKIFNDLKLKLEDILTDFLIYLDGLKKTTAVKKKKQLELAAIEFYKNNFEKIIYEVLLFRLNEFELTNTSKTRMDEDIAKQEFKKILKFLLKIL